MNEVSEIVRKGLDRAKAEERFERTQYEKNLREPKWNDSQSRWESPRQKLDAFENSVDLCGKYGCKPVTTSEPQPTFHEESIAEFSEDGKCSVRPLPDSEPVEASELYDYTTADRFRYASKATKTYNHICETQTGKVGNKEQLNKQQSEKDTLLSMSHYLAATIENASREEADYAGDESLFESMYRETNYSIFSYYLFSKVRKEAPKLKNRTFLPYVASQQRGKTLKALEFYCERHPFTRFMTFTSGPRVGLDDVRSRIEEQHRRISRLSAFMRKSLGMEIIFRSTELGTPKFKYDESETPEDEVGMFERDEESQVQFHVHTHCLVRFLKDRPFPPEEWDIILKQIWKFWGWNWDEGGSIRNVRELCKYVSKPLALRRLSPWEVLALYRATKGLHLVQPLGVLKDQIRTRKGFRKTKVNGKVKWDPTGKPLRLEKIDTPDGPVLREVHEWNCHRDKLKTDWEKNFEADEKKLNKLEKLINGTDGNEEPEIRILAKSVPGFAPGSLVTEPRIVVMATNWNQAAIDRHPLVQELKRRCWQQWRAGQELAAAIRVHKGAKTVPEPQRRFEWFEEEIPPEYPPRNVETHNFHTECSPI